MFFFVCLNLGKKIEEQTDCFDGSRLRTQGIVQVRFRKMPKNIQQVQAFFHWLKALLYFNPCSCVNEIRLIVELQTISLPLAGKYFYNISNFLKVQSYRKCFHRTQHVRTCFVTSYSGIYRVFFENVGNAVA